MAIMKRVCGNYRSPAAEYQNQRYGVGQRVFNSCTVCGASKAEPQLSAVQAWCRIGWTLK